MLNVLKCMNACKKFQDFSVTFSDNWSRAEIPMGDEWQAACLTVFLNPPVSWWPYRRNGMAGTARTLLLRAPPLLKKNCELSSSMADGLSALSALSADYLFCF